MIPLYTAIVIAPVNIGVHFCINSALDSSDPSERSDFIISEPVLVTFSPSNNDRSQEVFFPLVTDDINEAMEGFFVVVIAEGISDQTLDINLVRGGVTLVNILDDDRKQE